MRACGDKTFLKRNILLQTDRYVDLRDKHVLLTHTPLQTVGTRPRSYRIHDLLRADFTFRDVVEPITDDLFQSSVEFLHRDVLQLSVSYQSWNLLQERGEYTSCVVIGTYAGVTETVGGKNVDHCHRGRVGQWFRLGGWFGDGRVDELVTWTSFLTSWTPST